MSWWAESSRHCLASGKISYLYFSDRLMEFPLGLFGIALATVMLPTLSRQAANHSMEEFSRTIDWAMKLVVLIALPAAIGLVISGVATPRDLVLRRYFFQVGCGNGSHQFAGICAGTGWLFICENSGAGFFRPGRYQDAGQVRPHRAGNQFRAERNSGMVSNERRVCSEPCRTRTGDFHRRDCQCLVALSGFAAGAQSYAYGWLGSVNAEGRDRKRCDERGAFMVAASTLTGGSAPVLSLDHLNCLWSSSLALPCILLRLSYLACDCRNSDYRVRRRFQDVGKEDYAPCTYHRKFSV